MVSNKFKSLIGLTGLMASNVAMAAPLSTPVLTPEARQELLQGGHIIDVWQDKTREDGAIDVFGAIDIAASPETIWQIMVDCERALIVVKQMTSCEILDADPDGQWDVRKQKIKVGRFLPKSISIFRSQYMAPKSIKIELIGGNMKIQQGYWGLKAIAEQKTRVTYRAALRSKFPVPKGIIKKGVREDVPVILANMREMAEQDEQLIALKTNSVPSDPPVQ